MACEEQRKWFHCRLQVRDGSSNATYYNVSSAGSDIGIVDNNSVISVILPNCSSSANAPRAWDIAQSPGYFVFRPTADDLSSSFVQVNSYEDVINPSNRRRFQFDLLAAVDSSDTVGGIPQCSTTGPPDSLCGELYESETRISNALVFQWPQVPQLTEIGCCNISLDDLNNINGSQGNPTPINFNRPALSDCSRQWFVCDAGAYDSLRIYDFEEPSITALSSRGILRTSLGRRLVWHDIAWDNRGMLWGLSSDGIRRILPGPEVALPGTEDNAIVYDPATIDDPQGELTAIFENEDAVELPGSGCMAFNAFSQKFYVYIGERLFELSIVNDFTFRVEKSSSKLSTGSHGLGDFAFDAENNCICIYEGNIAVIDVFSPQGAGFGFIESITDDMAYANILGIDFILSSGSSEVFTCYAANDLGQIYEIESSAGWGGSPGYDPRNATYSLTEVGFVGNGCLGSSSCIVGEDLQQYSISFSPGPAPWLFALDASPSMSNQGSGSTIRSELVRDGLIQYINDYITDGEQISFVEFASEWANISTFTKVSDAVDYLSKYPSIVDGSSSGTARFCQRINNVWSSGFDDIVNIPADLFGNRLRSAVVIAGDIFASCDESGMQEYIASKMPIFRSAFGPQFKIKTVAINPERELNALKTLGELGAGGFTKWIG